MSMHHRQDIRNLSHLEILRLNTAIHNIIDVPVKVRVSASRFVDQEDCVKQPIISRFAKISTQLATFALSCVKGHLGQTRKSLSACSM